MPTYVYACTECGHRFEQHQAFTDDALTECPVCASRLRKLFNSVGVVFKGSGFYRNDSRESVSASAGSGSTDGKESGSKDSKGSADGDSKGSTSTDSNGSGGSGTTAAKGSGSKDSGSKGSGSKVSGSKDSGSSGARSTGAGSAAGRSPAASGGGSAA